MVAEFVAGPRSSFDRAVPGADARTVVTAMLAAEDLYTCDDGGDLV
ncbi:hypothetical protein [Bifidobacterium eulemuris]|uniref:Uncharacterized protein n=2 Tax=Bifidobacterium eulemuris TaxID=1765219 RepID=A0A7L9SRZ8_9BIFI|nr:hypothetical protein [Bifidobacterium eulemuris]QOL32892.1 hypothetical protein BE0216_10915 [Bifidobacterium eulemuris]